MSNIKLAQIETDKIISKCGLSLLDLPDSVCFDDFVNDDMTPEEVKEIAPDIAWEILDNADMDRDLVDSICYPESNWYK